MGSQVQLANVRAIGLLAILTTFSCARGCDETRSTTTAASNVGSDAATSIDGVEQASRCKFARTGIELGDGAVVGEVIVAGDDLYVPYVTGTGTSRAVHTLWDSTAAETLWEKNAEKPSAENPKDRPRPNEKTSPVVLVRQKKILSLLQVSPQKFSALRPEGATYVQDFSLERMHSAWEKWAGPHADWALDGTALWDTRRERWVYALQKEDERDGGPSEAIERAGDGRMRFQVREFQGDRWVESPLTEKETIPAMDLILLSTAKGPSAIWLEGGPGRVRARLIAERGGNLVRGTVLQKLEDVGLSSAVAPEGLDVGLLARLANGSPVFANVTDVDPQRVKRSVEPLFRASRLLALRKKGEIAFEVLMLHENERFLKIFECQR